MTISWSGSKKKGCRFSGKNVYSLEWKKSIKWFRCISQVFIADCPDASETAFERVLYKLVNPKTIAPTVVGKAKSVSQGKLNRESLTF